MRLSSYQIPSLDESPRSSLSRLCLIYPFSRSGANRNSPPLRSFLSTSSLSLLAKAFQLCARRYFVSNPILVVPLSALFVLFLFRSRAIHVFDFFSPQLPVPRARLRTTCRIDRLFLFRWLTFDEVAVIGFSTSKMKEMNVFFFFSRKILCCVFFVFSLENTKTWRKNRRRLRRRRYHCCCYHYSRHDPGDRRVVVPVGLLVLAVVVQMAREQRPRVQGVLVHQAEEGDLPLQHLAKHGGHLRRVMGQDGSQDRWGS